MKLNPFSSNHSSILGISLNTVLELIFKLSAIVETVIGFLIVDLVKICIICFCLDINFFFFMRSPIGDIFKYKLLTSLFYSFYSFTSINSYDINVFIT